MSKIEQFAGAVLGNVFNSVFQPIMAQAFGQSSSSVGGQLTFPLENQQDYGGYILFTATQEPPKALQDLAFADLLEPVIEKVENSETEIQTVEFGNTPEVDLSEAVSSAKKSNSTPIPEHIGKGRTCKLYLPQAIQFADAVSYTNIELGILGAVAERALNSGQSGTEILKNMGQDILGSFESLGTALRQGMQSEAAQVAALRFARRLNSGVAGAISTSTGIALNPNKRSMLQGPELRTFRFTFKMIPTSPDEAREVKAIIQYFREEMYPEATNDLGVSAALKYPSKFDIALKYRKANGSVGKVATGILPCFLRSVDVNYNASGMAFHGDGEAYETDLTLQFVEERTLTKADVAVGGY